MERERINRISGIVPVLLSLVAFGEVIVAVLTGWGMGSGDEGPAAHLFQLLIVAEVPVILVFLATAEWTRFVRLAGFLALQAAAVLLAFAPVAFFKL